MALQSVPKHLTGIEGFDHISSGGLPRGRTTLISGTSGSAKTVFAVQFLASGIEAFDEPGVFVTFEESPTDIRRNVEGFGWDVASWEAAGRWAFVDASPQIDDEPITEIGAYDLGALIARIEHAIRRVGARRIAIDSIAGLFNQLDNPAVLRSEMFRLMARLKALDVTVILTSERVEEYGPISRFGVEEFVSDNVMVFRNVLEDELRRRTVEILKFRGTSHQKGEWPFTVVSGRGVVIIPLSALQLEQHSSVTRITSGDRDLDAMTGGGFFRDSVILVSGPTGTGKTLISTEFLAGGADRGERCLLFAFEESREQLFRNASGWGIDFAALEAQGLLKVVCTYPEAATLEDHLIFIKGVLDDYRPNRVAVDSLSALERGISTKAFREFVIGLSSFIKHREIPAIFTATTSDLLGGGSSTEAQISSTTDSIILLRYVEMHGQMRRGLAVLKMRGSMHDKEIREFTIDGTGLHIGKSFRNVHGILSGNFTHVTSGDLDRLDAMFVDGGREDGHPRSEA